VWYYGSCANFEGVLGVQANPPLHDRDNKGTADTVANPLSLSSGHAATVQVVLMDGSVRGVSGSVDKENLARACTPDDGQVLSGDW
jgi:hypothetical protein